MVYDDCVILLYAKAPHKGKVNTRLIPDIGVEAATKLQDDLIHHRLSMLGKAQLCDVRLMCLPDHQDDYFVQRKKQYDIDLFDQRGNDLGERMSNGVTDALQQYRHCIVIGTDAPALDEKLITQVIDRLFSKEQVVLVPAEDGGYVLIAMSSAHACVFQDVNWGSNKVMQQTIKKLSANNISYETLPICWDIDTVEDYQRYLQLIAVPIH
ncbi:MAG: TIGR04282 family arsenosugar biosynthesis glycosyltransferase [Gammaproteobacteria bacterium]|nr:TIGR04282 family arsenosugar biosynthesis glycosyltransferase [Gammaproteobacteria bacterium]